MPAAQGQLDELVVCSLEEWDEVWRRNQFFVDILLKRNPRLRVLFVEPAADPLYDLANRRKPKLRRTRSVEGYGGRLRSFRPLKPLPRRLGSISDRALSAQVRAAARAVGFARPTLWINDVTYAPLIRRTGWPSLYDVTDDWLLMAASPDALSHLRELDAAALRGANEVVVCSQSLLQSRGRARGVTLIPNGVDLSHFQRPRPRPLDLPPAPTAVYVGSLHDERLDVELVLDLARQLPNLHVVLVGPDSLSLKSRGDLRSGGIELIGPRPYADVPGYLQHADVVIVPHKVSPFTESLDPIKAYESLAVSTPTVATPVAGFRERADDLVVVERGQFVPAVARILALEASPLARSRPVPSWEGRATEFEASLRRASRAHA